METHHRLEAMVFSQPSTIHHHEIFDLGWTSDVEKMLILALEMPPSHLFKYV